MSNDQWTEGDMVSKETRAQAAEDKKAWQLLDKTLQASLQEQRRSRRWGIFGSVRSQTLVGSN